MNRVRRSSRMSILLTLRQSHLLAIIWSAGLHLMLCCLSAGTEGWSPLQLASVMARVDLIRDMTQPWIAASASGWVVQAA